MREAPRVDGGNGKGSGVLNTSLLDTNSVVHMDELFAATE